jgi:hypothetical protein
MGEGEIDAPIAKGKLDPPVDGRLQRRDRDFQALALRLCCAARSPRRARLVHLVQHPVHHGVRHSPRHTVEALRLRLGPHQRADTVDPLLLEARLDGVHEGLVALREQASRRLRPSARA